MQKGDFWVWSTSLLSLRTQALQFHFHCQSSSKYCSHPLCYGICPMCCLFCFVFPFLFFNFHQVIKSFFNSVALVKSTNFRSVWAVQMRCIHHPFVILNLRNTLQPCFEYWHCIIYPSEGSLQLPCHTFGTPKTKQPADPCKSGRV